MESNERNQMSNGDATNNRDVDWSRYGLHNNAESQRNNETPRNNINYE